MAGRTFWSRDFVVRTRRCQVEMAAGMTKPTTDSMNSWSIDKPALTRNRRSSSLNWIRPVILDLGILFSPRRYSF
jgi:hypothetical protein